MCDPPVAHEWAAAEAAMSGFRQELMADAIFQEITRNVKLIQENKNDRR